ncbi:hypothetical protein JW758_02910 [Candidatus Peregrinibacteria bacterium]|nr:hypothetical protein [Candidatus Peregrinibacteria bacterium]
MKKILLSLMLPAFICTLTGCGTPKDDIALCKEKCEQAMSNDQKQFCLSACETAKEFSEKMKEVPVNDVVNDFNDNIYGNMNEAQKLKMEAMQEAGQIPADLNKIPTPPSNPEDWEPNDDGFGDEGEGTECAGAFCD